MWSGKEPPSGLTSRRKVPALVPSVRQTSRSLPSLAEK